METKLVCLMIFVLSSCSQFPTERFYKVDSKNKICKQYKIINQDPIKFEFDHVVKYEECPNVYGFHEDEIGDVMNYIRDMQKKSKECQ